MNTAPSQHHRPQPHRLPRRVRHRVTIGARFRCAFATGVLAVCVLAAAAPPAAAQAFSADPTDAPPITPPTVVATASREAAYVGDSVEYQVIIETREDPPEPQISWPDTVSAQLTGRSSSQRSSTGIDPSGRAVVTTRRFVIYTYRVVPARAGTLTIPPARVRLNGADVASNAVSIRVREPEAATGFSLTAELERPTLYVGEPARLQLVWTVGAEATPPSLDSSILPDSFEISPDQAAIASVPRTQLYESSIDGVSIVGRVEDAANAQPTRLIFDLIVRPTRPGSFELGPFVAVFDQTSRSRPRVRALSRAPAIAVEVIEPPADSRPPAYTGLIGDYQLRASIDRNRVAVGDPIELTLTIRGPEPMPAALQPPVLARIPGFAQSFRLSPDGWTEAARSFGQREYRTTIRASTPDAARVPAITLPTFDPGSGEYQLATTDPIPLSVRAVREVTARDAVVGSTTPQPAAIPNAPDPVPLLSSAAAAWATDRAGPVLAAKPAMTLDRRLIAPTSIAALSFGPVMAFAALLVRRRRIHAATPAARRARAVRAALRAHPADPAAAIRAVVATLRAVPPASITAADLDALPLAPDDRAALSAALTHADRVRYANATSSAIDSAPRASRPDRAAPDRAALDRAMLSRLARALLPDSPTPAEARP